MVDRKSGKINAHVMPQEGVHPYAVKRVVQDIRLLGYTRINLKSDQGHANRALLTAVKNEQHCEIVTEMSPVGESQADGEIEGVIKIIKGVVRTMRLALQTRYGILIGEKHPIVPWMIRES